MSQELSAPGAYEQLVNTIGVTYEGGKKEAFKTVNKIIVDTYWRIGQYIVEYEQQGHAKAPYGEGLMERLAKDLRKIHGKGFSRSNLSYMRKLYLYYPERSGVSDELSWSHMIELLKIENQPERQFYALQTASEKWSVRELQRQKSTALYQRLALSRSPRKLILLSQEGQVLEVADDILRDPYIFEFLNLPEHGLMKEADLEKLLIDHLQEFLLELGKGFSLIGRQHRISIDNRHFYVDLMFYHIILKCFVLIDLKTREVTHEDVGQMNMYLEYVKQEENVPCDNPPIGMILGTGKHEVSISYALAGLNSNVFVSRYQLHLPDKDELQRVVEHKLIRIKEDDDLNQLE